MPDENFTQKINKKMYRAGMASILSQLAARRSSGGGRFAEGGLPKTKGSADKFKAMNLTTCW